MRKAQGGQRLTGKRPDRQKPIRPFFMSTISHISSLDALFWFLDTRTMSHFISQMPERNCFINEFNFIDFSIFLCILQLKV